MGTRGWEGRFARFGIIVAQRLRHGFVGLYGLRLAQLRRCGLLQLAGRHAALATRGEEPEDLKRFFVFDKYIY